MNLEIDFLTRLAKHTEETRKANLKLQNEKNRIIANTVDTKEYCLKVGIARSTLTRHRDEGKIPFIMLGAEYRYFLPKKGVSHD
jgi:hypothetical protein